MSAHETLPFDSLFEQLSGVTLGFKLSSYSRALLLLAIQDTRCELGHNPTSAIDAPEAFDD